MNEILLIAAAFATSTLTAVTGVGGGMTLIAIMPGLMPAAAIVPVHGVVQLCANSSRALFGWRHLQLAWLSVYVAGGIAGGALAGALLRHIDLEYTPLLIAAYILYSIWGPPLRLRFPARVEFAALGLVQTGLGMIVGATGPMGQATLLRRGLGRDSLVVTSAAMMSFAHLIKVAAFAALGFAFLDYWQLITGMAVAVIAGAWSGTRLRGRLPEQRFRQLLRWLLTLLAARMIYLALT